MEVALGLRERKKQQTRERISETARALFIERGFEAVTIDEIAGAAEVSRMTVFNYFPAKEDLVYWRLENFEDKMLAAVRARRRGESIPAAFARFVLTHRLLGQRDSAETDSLMALTRTIAASPALLARESQIFERYAAALAELIAAETAADEHDVAPWVAANALMGVHRSLVTLTRQRLVAGVRNPELGREVHKQGRRAFALLERGLGELGTCPACPVKLPAGKGEDDEREQHRPCHGTAG
jgi:AcrR family transcriptional regulator